jgi:hypothetical protein
MPVFIPVSSKTQSWKPEEIFEFLCIQPFFSALAGDCRSAADSVFFKGVPKPFDDGVADSVAAAGKLQFLHNLGNRR